jgi:aminoglycoside phosphotransferase (APT) family kinase protein
VYRYGRFQPALARINAENEYHNLKMARDEICLRDGPFTVVCPLGLNEELSALLVTTRAEGRLLDHYIMRAAYAGRWQKLYDKLGYLARFFARLHSRSRTNQSVSAFLARAYLKRLLPKIAGELSRNDRAEIEGLADFHWTKAVVIGQDNEVTVHGDANPTNFFFYRDRVTAIDLEEMKQGDRCWDLGFIAAELKHHFYWRTGDRWRGEPFIGHFLWEYAQALEPQTEDFFHTITRKLPLYMALGLLRITRNHWLDPYYRRHLVEEAKLCLRYGR